VIRSELDVLLDRVEDPILRGELLAQIDKLASRRSFGLVFEAHLPERVRLPHHTIRRGVRVTLRDEEKAPTFDVVSVNKKLAIVRKVRHPDGSSLDADEAAEAGDESLALGSLVVIADFGDPIYPGLRRLGSIDRCGDKPAHVVIKGENHHALQALSFTHAGRVDCIYIDPPYNSGARDWKYDNSYVDENDGYRHSKWLAFMDRRLRLAKTLLNPDDSVLIVTIDEKEYLRLGLLLEQTFRGAVSQMVSSVINPAGTGRQNEFHRTNEYIFFIQFGEAVIQPMLPKSASEVPVEWEPFRRRDLASKRGTSKGGRAQFYPIYVDRTSGHVAGTGDPLAHDQDRDAAPQLDGCASVFPVREDGTEMNWALTREEFERRLSTGYVRVGRHQPGGPQEYVISYLRTGPIADIEAGRAVVSGHNPDGSVVAKYPMGKKRMPLTQWDFASHDAQRYGTTLLQSFTPGRRFPFPKSLYAVEDALRIAVDQKPNAVIVDFFAGSGTTAHAVARLNRQDNGRRQSISITNNEVSAEEAAALRSQGQCPGDPGWEVLGIFEYITRPRVAAAFTGVTPEGNVVEGEYKYTDEFPMAEGFAENAEFFELNYLDPEDVELDMAWSAVAPLMWMRSGGIGPVIADRKDSSGQDKPFEWTSSYGVLWNCDHWRGFVKERPESAKAAFIVTDSQATFAGVASELPDSMDAVRLYENYLTTFSFTHGDG
jgi:adenine-specific DNA-methyltransferase